MYSSLLGPIFYFYIYVSSSVLSYCSIKHDDDDDDDDDDDPEKSIARLHY